MSEIWGFYLDITLCDAPIQFANLASNSLSEHGRFRFDVALKLKLNPGKSLLTQFIVL